MTLGGFQTLFPAGKELLQSYDFFDIASSTGFILFDGKGTHPTAGDTHSLVPSKDASALSSSIKIEGAIHSTISGRIGSGTFYKVFDIDFDTSAFQLPQTIEGVAQVRTGIAVDVDSAGDFTCYYLPKLRKWDGSTETEIASTTSKEFDFDADTEFGFELPITVPRTLIKKGEQLRLTIEFWCKEASGATNQFNSRIGYWPLDNAFDTTIAMTAGNTRTVIAIPFKIEV